VVVVVGVNGSAADVGSGGQGDGAVAVWAETKAPGEALSINSYRRSLAQEHLRDAAAPEDARTLARQNLTSLRVQLQAALEKAGLKMPPETRAYLAESVARVDETLKANMQRMAF